MSVVQEESCCQITRMHSLMPVRECELLQDPMCTSEASSSLQTGFEFHIAA